MVSLGLISCVKKAEKMLVRESSVGGKVFVIVEKKYKSERACCDVTDLFTRLLFLILGVS